MSSCMHYDELRNMLKKGHTRKGKTFNIYKDPKPLNVITEEQLSRFLISIVRKRTSRTPFSVKSVVKFNDFYNKVNNFLLNTIYKLEVEGEWAKLVGSYAEKTCIKNSDVDFIKSLGPVFCDTDHIEPGRLRAFLVQTNDEQIPPGCCWLRLFDQRTDYYLVTGCKERNGLEWVLHKGEVAGDFKCESTEIDGHTHYPYETKMDKVICYKPALVRRKDGFQYFSSKKFSEYHSRAGLTRYKTLNKLLPNWSVHGPANTQKYLNTFKIDVTISLTCLNSWPDSAHEWTIRERPNKWPTEELVKDILQSGFDVVAIPSKMTLTDDNDIEWRLSFVSAIEKLISTFNECQRSCYIILKVITKEFIEPQYPQEDLMTSFIMKNLVFWIIEETESFIWEERNLIYCLRLCFRKLSSWIKDGYCPHYFIPKYNLFRTKLENMNKLGFRKWLLENLERDWAILLHCTTFKKVKKMWENASYCELKLASALKSGEDKTLL